MYKGHMDKAKGGRFEGGRWGWVEWRAWWMKMETMLRKTDSTKLVEKRYLDKNHSNSYFSILLPFSLTQYVTYLKNIY